MTRWAAVTRSLPASSSSATATMRFDGIDVSGGGVDRPTEAPPRVQVSVGYLTLSGDLVDDRRRRERLESLCDRVWCDDLGSHAARATLLNATTLLVAGDRLVVHRLSDLGLTIVQFAALLERFGGNGIHLLSIEEGIVDGSPLVKALVDVGARLALMQREVKRSRAARGTAIAVRDGRLRGARPALTPQMMETVKKLMSHPTLTMAEIASAVGTSRNTLYRTLKREHK